MPRRLVVEIVGDTSGLQRAFRRAELGANRYMTKSRAYGRRLRTGGMFAASAASALGLERYVDNAAESIVGHFGVGGDAQTAVGDLTAVTADLGLESKQAAKLIGKAGLAGAVGFASYKMSGMILKATGLDKKLEQLGGTAYNTATALGIVNDPMDQFKGKATPTPGLARFIHNQAVRLQAGGMTREQSAARIAATHPNLARRDIDVFAGVTAPNRPMVIQVNIDGREVGRAVTTEQTRAAARKAKQTSGFRG